MVSTDGLLTYSEISRLFGVDEGTLRVWRHRGRFPAPDKWVPGCRGMRPAWYVSTVEDVAGLLVGRQKN